LDIAREYGIKVCFHIEPYRGRTPLSVRSDIAYILGRYGKHEAFYRVLPRSSDSNSSSSPPPPPTVTQHHLRGGQAAAAATGGKPLFYIYDSYHSDAHEWATILAPGGDKTIRGTSLDSVVIGLFVEASHYRYMESAKFDGFYTYFATDGFTYGSTRLHWKEMSEFAARNQMTFIPSVGPGYVDTMVRPWNEVNTRSRGENAHYYDASWQAALAVAKEPNMAIVVSIVSITSFNEWHEGTQIEPAVEKQTSSFTYEDYRPHTAQYFLERTMFWSDQLSGLRPPPISA